MHDPEHPPETPAKGRSTYLVPIGIILFCGVAYWLTTTFDRVPPILMRGMQPADFPQMVLSLIIMLSVFLLIWDRAEAPDPMSGVVWATIGLLIGFTFLAQIDLFLALGVFAGSLTVFWGERRPWAIGLVTLIVPLLVFFLFDRVFEVRFPHGLLTNIWYG